jgi:hypothetical protein
MENRNMYASKELADDALVMSSVSKFLSSDGVLQQNIAVRRIMY